jgi:hypothetical protein
MRNAHRILAEEKTKLGDIVKDWSIISKWILKE